VTSLLNRLDYEVAYERTAPDHPKRIRDQINLLKDEFDVLIVTGGMSMGEHDHVPRVLKELGFQSRVSKLRMKPGKPFVFAARRRGDQPQFAFGLPGNPVSAFCCTLLLVSRLLDRIEGATPRVSPVECVLAESVPANGPREFYQPALREGYKVRPLAWRGSADVFTLAQADVLLIRPENDGPREAGAVVRCIEMPA
jgi:molybdopterin molybdotransferase